jgi:rhomboid family GlyGly-CTERM serine protease
MMASNSKGARFQLIAVFVALVFPSFCIELYDTFALADDRFYFGFDRELIAQGQWWRLLVGHFDHLGWSHLALNAAFLAVLLFSFAMVDSFVKVVTLVCFYSLGISLFILLFSVELDRYVGLSGCLYSLLVLGLLRDGGYPYWIRLLVFVGLLVKVGYEYFSGAQHEISEIIGGAVATDVHLYGVLLGVLSAGILKYFRL